MKIYSYKILLNFNQICSNNSVKYKRFHKVIIFIQQILKREGNINQAGSVELNEM